MATGLYTGKLTGEWGWYVDGALTYVSDKFADTSNVGIQSASTRLDTSFGVNNGEFSAAIFVRNAFDDDAITDAGLYVDFRAGFAPNAFGYLPDPRTFGLRAAMKV